VLLGPGSLLSEQTSAPSVCRWRGETWVSRPLYCIVPCLPPARLLGVHCFLLGVPYI
jgi:hypothetical protein